MSDASDLQKCIQNRIAALSVKDLKRPSMSIQQFVHEYGTTISQASVDKSALISAGFIWENISLYEALHEMLALSLGECIDAKLIISKKRTELNSVVIKADEFRTILIQSARYTVNKLNDPKLTGKYKQIISASEKTKVIASILDLVALIKEHSETASQIRPAGITVDAAYLQRATDCAMALLQLRGQVTLETEPLTLAIARQKRLVTLCMESRNEIKTFAYAAFRNNLLYYKRYYTSSVRRMQNTKYKSAQ